MITAARLYSLFLLLIAVGNFIAGIADSAKFGVAGVIGAFLVPVIVGLPTVSALIALGKVKPRTEAFSLFVNKAYLFLFAAAAIGYAFKLTEGPNPLFVALLFAGGMFAVSFLLNAVALQRQRNKRAAGAQQGAQAGGSAA